MESRIILKSSIAMKRSRNNRLAGTADPTTVRLTSDTEENKEDVCNLHSNACTL